MYRIMAGLICDQGRLHPMSLTLVFSFLIKTFKILRKCSRWLLLLPVDRPSSWQCKKDFYIFSAIIQNGTIFFRPKTPFLQKKFKRSFPKLVPDENIPNTFIFIFIFIFISRWRPGVVLDKNLQHIFIFISWWWPGADLDDNFPHIFIFIFIFISW